MSLLCEATQILFLLEPIHYYKYICYRSSKIKIINDARSRVLEKQSVLDALFIVPVFLLVPVASITFSLLGSTGFSLNFVAENIILNFYIS